MKKLIIIALLSFTSMTNVVAQNVLTTLIATYKTAKKAAKDAQQKKLEQDSVQQTTSMADKVFDKVDEMPSFPGGQGAMMEFLSKNIKYPIVAEENGIQGRVLVKIVVKKDGTIDSPKVIKSVDPSLDKEAIRVVKTMPKWIPGKQKGEPVNVSFTVPVTFRI